MLYDETNDKTIMARANTDGSLTIVGTIDGAVTVAVDGDGTATTLHTAEQNNQNQLAVNTDNVEDQLNSIFKELRIMNFHLSNMTDMQISREDIT
jgi:hypothetical protein